MSFNLTITSILEFQEFLDLVGPNQDKTKEAELTKELKDATAPLAQAIIDNSNSGEKPNA